VVDVKRATRKEDKEENERRNEIGCRKKKPMVVNGKEDGTEVPLIVPRNWVCDEPCTKKGSQSLQLKRHNEEEERKGSAQPTKS